MKKYTPYIIITILSIGLGTIIGKFLFEKESTSNSHQHSEPDTAVEETYTCSMHPQIRQNESGICPICEMDLIPVGSSENGDDPAILQMTAEAAKLAQVATTTVTSSPGTIEGTSIKVEGIVSLDESLTNVQAAHIGGRIDQLSVSFEGQYVKKGQLIATLYASELLTATKELLTAVKNEDRFPGLKDAAIQKVKNWRITDKQIQEVISSGTPIQDINLYADYSGFITERMVSEGDHVNEGDLLYKLASTSRLWVEFNVFEKDLPNVKTGQVVDFGGPALGDQSIRTTISYIDPILDQKSRSVIARAQVANRNNLLKPGMLVQGKITSKKSSASSLLIPKTSVLWTGERSVVYVALQNEEGILEYQYREVVLGDPMGAYFQVMTGLEEGEEVVSNGAFAIDASAQLNNNYSMMNHDISIKEEGKGLRNPNFTEQVTENFKSQLESYVNSYLSMKDAFVESDPVLTSQRAADAQRIIGEVSHVSLEVEAHEFWIERYNPLKIHLQKITEGSDISDQRKQFEFASELTIDLIEAFGMNDRSYYIQYCPMAFDNKGAEWLSGETGIRNPYFGDKMLKCGQVTDTIGMNN